MKSINELTHRWCEEHQILSLFKETTESTNLWAKTSHDKISTLSVFLADHQTQGRGRGNNSWSNAAPGTTLLSTWCLRLPQTPHPLLSIRTGLLLWNSLSLTWPTFNWAIKAPNDVYVDDGKFAGILIEVEQSLHSAQVYIGLGANIYSNPTNIEQKTFALADSYEKSIAESWPLFCNHLSKGLFNLTQDAQRSRLTLGEMKQLLIALKKYYKNEVQEIHADGSLILKNNDHIQWNEL